MISDNGLVIVISADSKNFKKDLEDALKGVKKFSKGAKEETDDAKKSFINLGDVANAALGFSIANAVAEGVSALRQLAVDGVKNAAALQQAMQSLNLVIGGTADALVDDLSEAARGTVTSLELVAASNRALALGVDRNNLVPLMEVARARAKLMGISVTQAFNDITLGIGRQSKMILDNLGIVIDLDKTYKEYAATLGKTAEALSDLEKREALQGAILSRNADLVQAMNLLSETQVDSYARVKTAGLEAFTEVGGAIAFAVTESADIVSIALKYNMSLREAKVLLDQQQAAQSLVTQKVQEFISVSQEIDQVNQEIIGLNNEMQRLEDSSANIVDELRNMASITLTGEREGQLAVQEKSNELDEARLELLKLQAKAQEQFGEKNLVMNEQQRKAFIEDEGLTGARLKAFEELSNAQSVMQERVDSLRMSLEQLRLEQNIEFDNFKGIQEIKANMVADEITGVAKTKDELQKMIPLKVAEWKKEQEAISAVNNELEKQKQLLDELEKRRKKSLSTAQGARADAGIIRTPTLPSRINASTPMPSPTTASGVVRSVVNVSIDRVSGADPDDLSEALRTRLGDLIGTT